MPNLIVGLGAAMPAFAESFPSNGVMLENKTYSGAATYENLRTYAGTLDARAQYIDTLQQIIGGTYLPAGATVAEQCPENSYCPGVTDATINASESQGATSCPSGYPNSAVGASSNTQCYTACTLKSANIEHATAVSGNDYYGDGTDTCAATACENGYHVYETAKLIEQRPLIDIDLTVAGNDNGYISADYARADNGYEYGLTEDNTWATEFDYGVVYGRASCNATSFDTVMAYLDENTDAIMAGTKPLYQVRSDLTPIVGATNANYVANLVARIVDGDTLGEEEFSEFMNVLSFFEDAPFSTSDTGQYCYCQMTGFLSEPRDEESGYYDISRAVAIESAPWTYAGSLGSANKCAQECALGCARAVETDVSESGNGFRAKLFGAFVVTDAFTCDANRIKIRWTDAAEEDIAANNAGMCTYGGDIRTPVRAATKPGKTFVGWKLLPQPE